MSWLGSPYVAVCGGAGEPALAPDRGRILVSRDTLFHQRPRQVKGVVRPHEGFVVKTVFDPNPSNRTDAEWRLLLGGLVESLSSYTGIRFAPISYFIEDHPGHASAGGCVDVRGSVSPALRLEACAVVCISVNHGEAAWASATVLMYAGGRRVFGPDGSEIVYFRYTPKGWSGLGWMNGECGEWEGYLTDERWQQAEPEVAPDCGGIT